MQIEFVRSGGFAGAATNGEGTVTLEGNGGRVRSDMVQFSRDLTPDEARQLRAAGESAAGSKAKDAAKSDPGPTRDAYQYDVSITNDAGKTIKLAAPAAAPEAKTLLEWVQAETKKIWTFRAGAGSAGKG